MATDFVESMTPESTGSGDENSVSFPGSDTSSSSAAAVKKSHRQTAFYPHVNSSNKTQKPFSRSAAKRESVMALGSIEHLQYYFTKTGLKAKRNPLDKPHHGLVPAIGGSVHSRTNPSITSISDLPLPPTPVVPHPPPNLSLAPHIKSTEIDPETLLPGVIDDLSAVSHAWRIDEDLSSSPSGGEHHFDVLDVLQTTTRAIRSTRNYLLSLPDESAGTIREHFRSNRLTPAASSSASGRSSSSSQQQQPDPLTLIRRSALEVLAALREIEEKTRLPLSDDAYDAQSDGGASRGVGGSSSNGEGEGDSEEQELTGLHEVDSTPVAFSLVQVQGRYESVPVWEDPDADGFLVDEDEGKEKRDRWDERLVLGGGWLYRQDVTLESLEKEKRLVGEYLDVVDEVLFEGKKGAQGAQRGWEKQRAKLLHKARGSARRRVSAGDVESRSLSMLLESSDVGKRRVSTGILSNMMGGLNISEEPPVMEGITEEVEADEHLEDVPDSALDDDELPDWAKRHAFMDNDLDRVHALLSFLLPADLQSALSPDASSRSVFLESLSSGQLLCVAYNSGVRKSKKPWGYVNKHAIHDILALEKAEAASAADEDGEPRKKGWTFRRTDNLRLWVGALKLRYMLPVIIPTQLLSTSTGSGSGSATPGSSNTPLGSPLPLSQKFPTTEPPVEFDAKVVARKDEGWEDMLEAVLLRWMWKVVDERRMDR